MKKAAALTHWDDRSSHPAWVLLALLLVVLTLLWTVKPWVPLV